MAEPMTEREAARAATVARVLDLAGVEVAAGLPNEQGRLGEARINCDYYNGENEGYIERREAETAADYAARPKRCLLITQRVVDILTSHLYNPGPARRFDAPAAVAEWLGLAYQEANAALMAADQQSTLNDVSLIQVAPTGDPSSPIRFHVWGSEAFAVWTDPDHYDRPLAVATIDRQDDTTRYTLWGEKLVRVYLTEKSSGMTSGGRTAREVDRYVNPYGCLPFAVVAHRHQCGSFWVTAPGTPVRKLNANVDTMLSDLGQAIKAHLFPVGVALNVHEEFNPVLKPGGFIRIAPDNTDINGQAAALSEIKYVQATVETAQTWVDCESIIANGLDMAGVPKSAVRMEQTGTASGIAIVAEQMPLITRAKQRQPLAARWEQDLARVILKVGGAWYRRPDLYDAAKTIALTLSWPQVSIPLPGPDQDNADAWEIDQGIASKIDVLMRRRGISRDEAIETLRRVEQDNALIDSMITLPAEPTIKVE